MSDIFLIWHHAAFRFLLRQCSDWPFRLRRRPGSSSREHVLLGLSVGEPRPLAPPPFRLPALLPLLPTRHAPPPGSATSHDVLSASCVVPAPWAKGTPPLPAGPARQQPLRQCAPAGDRLQTLTVLACITESRLFICLCSCLCLVRLQERRTFERTRSHIPGQLTECYPPVKTALCRFSLLSTQAPTPGLHLQTLGGAHLPSGGALSTSVSHPPAPVQL